MDQYPKEHLDGVTPLIFAVNATINVKKEAGDNSNQRSSSASGSGDGAETVAFGLFCDYIAARKSSDAATQEGQAADKSKDKHGGDPLSGALHAKSSGRGSSSASGSGSGSGSTTTTTTFAPFSKKNKAKAKTSDFFSHARVVPVSTRHAFPPSKDPHGTKNAVSKLNNALYATRKHKLMPSQNPYQQAAAQMQQANPQTSSSSSADHQQTQIIQQQQTNVLSPIASILAKNPVEGILPEGWIVKHTHALPAALILVTSLDLTNTVYEQARLEQHLTNTIESITATSAKKRDCPIHLVCLIPTNPAFSSPKDKTIEAERVGNIRTICRLGNSSVTALHHFKNSKGEVIFLKDDFDKMENAVHDGSMLYYLTQVRRCKRKHSLLRHDKFEDLLPFAARYCIKIAVFYEFQSWSDKERGAKSIKYWNEAYRNVRTYYQYLQGESVKLQAIREDGDNSILTDSHSHSRSKDEASRSVASSVGEQTDISHSGTNYTHQMDDNSDDDSLLTTDLKSSHPPPPSQGDGVEVALVGSPRIGNEKMVAIGATSPKENVKKKITDETEQQKIMIEGDLETETSMMRYSKDMIQQCRAVADLLNIKLLVTCYASAVEATKNSGDSSFVEPACTFEDLADQVRTHSQIFLSSPKSVSENLNSDVKALDPTWYFLAFVARQRIVLAQFFERQPILSLDIQNLSAEVLSYCNALQHYSSYGEIMLKLGQKIKSNPADFKIDSSVKFSGAERQRFVGGLGSQDLMASFQDELSRDHEALALDAFGKAIEIAKSNTLSPNVLRMTAKVHFVMAGILMHQGHSTSALDNLKKSKQMVQSFPSLRIAIDNALSKCLAALDRKEESSLLSARLLLDCGTNRILSKSELSIQKQNTVGANNTGPLEWQYGIESTQPLYFSLTFPENLHATEGDTIPGTFHLQSNLPFPVAISDIQITTNIGGVTLSNWVQKEILPRQIIRMPAIVEIPIGCMKNINMKVLEKQAIKGAKPNTFGLTKIGGGVYTSEVIQEKLTGGLCLSCLGADFKLTISNESWSSEISLKLYNNHRGSFPKPNVKDGGSKRALLEEDNFVFSSWSRPDVFSINSGPRCLRVLRAQSNLDITDLTSCVTSNKVMEGAVNRILIKLHAGDIEQCRDLKMRVTCSSWVESEGQEQTSLLDLTENSQSSRITPQRSPFLVRPSSKSSVEGDQIIPGWVPLRGKNEGESQSEWTKVADLLDCNDEIISFFDLYRALPQFEDDTNYTCKTDFVVTISYKQIRLDQSNKDADRDSVVQTYESTVDWCSPFATKFSIISGKEGAPSGSKHPSNYVTNINSAVKRNSVNSGSNVGIACSLHSPGADNELAVEVTQVKFQNHNRGRNSACQLSLVHNHSKDVDTEILYKPKTSSFWNKLTSGTKLKVAYTIKPQMKSDETAESAQVTSTHLGAIAIHFIPIPLHNSNFEISGASKILSGYHGPLPIDELPSSKHKGPLLYVETTPFDACYEVVPPLPRVSCPFEVRYKITNKTYLHQKLKISMTEAEGTANGMLVSGIINGELALGPMESTTISYSMLVTKIGKAVLPDLSVSSLRYNTWILRGIRQDTSIYVMP
eukprot:CAMPEP_0194109444 /NCGR_PEP_ID=MMETSP0150-20130528/8927_1 /TAXON_ID=122233 /ORGANISM="Chaetoceros debilis, Strain MM31A-1" /LENGTH=1586 /DNA_ID=CAMNT_0038798395 /DNA_START=209 /DNA_END=4966 /DNA_ORIENTATION=-